MGKAPEELGTRANIMVTNVAFHPVEDVLAIGFIDGMILGVRLADGKEALLRRPGKGAITSMDWSATGKLLAFASEAGDCGSHLNRVFVRQFGVTPAVYRAALS